MRRFLAGVLRVAEWPLVSGDAASPGADAIVVLGAPVGADGRVPPMLAERVRIGVELWRAGLAPVVCMTGGVSRAGLPAEAEAMADEARRLGLPEDSLLVEARSMTTYENAMFVANLLLPERSRIWVVTTPFHTRRGKRWFRAAGFDVRAWHARDSLQYADPAKALKWVAREYLAWAHSGLLSVRDRVRPGRGDR